MLESIAAELDDLIGGFSAIAATGNELIGEGEEN